MMINHEQPFLIGKQIWEITTVYAKVWIKKTTKRSDQRPFCKKTKQTNMQYKQQVSRFSPSQFIFSFLDLYTLPSRWCPRCECLASGDLWSLHNTELTVVLLLCCCDLHIFRCVSAATGEILANQKWGSIQMSFTWQWQKSFLNCRRSVFMCPAWEHYCRSTEHRPTTSSHDSFLNTLPLSSCESSLWETLCRFISPSIWLVGYAQSKSV